MFESYRIFLNQGKQFIPDLTGVELPPGTFMGRPEIEDKPCAEGCKACADNCPTHAIQLDPVSLDLGRCVACSECVRLCSENKIQFTSDYKTATNDRKRLIIKEGDKTPVVLDPALIREEIGRFFGNSLKLRQVSAGGDGSNEWECNACSNVHFDMGRFGIEWTASPRHADGVVITGPITQNMSEALQITYEAIPNPKIVVLAGSEAISGGIFEGSQALNREFLSKYKVDLYVPGAPFHPLTLINGILELIKKRKYKQSSR